LKQASVNVFDGKPRSPDYGVDTTADGKVSEGGN